MHYVPYCYLIYTCHILYSPKKVKERREKRRKKEILQQHKQNKQKHSTTSTRVVLTTTVTDHFLEYNNNDSSIHWIFVFIYIYEDFISKEKPANYVVTATCYLLVKRPRQDSFTELANSWSMSLIFFSLWLYVRSQKYWQGANVCSPEHTSDTSTNCDSFLNWTFSSPNMIRTVQTLLHSQLACNEMQASARTCSRRAADSMIENVG